MPRRSETAGKRAHNFIDMTGQHIGRVLITQFAGLVNQTAMWDGLCDCGNPAKLSRVTIRRWLREGALPSSRWECVPSCGCSYKEGSRKERLGYRFKVPRPVGQTGFRYLLKQYQTAAHNRGLEWSLVESEFAILTKRRCHYCGSIPNKVCRSAGRDRGQDYLYNGIDRKDNSLG